MIILLNIIEHIWGKLSQKSKFAKRKALILPYSGLPILKSIANSA